MQIKGKKVYVGLSGGVDSAVTAALLKKAGADLTGVFIKGWYPPGLPCTWAKDRQDAMRVAAKLHIPFRTFDASTEYKQNVIDYLIREYGAGRTPNPDIMCNREVKFGAFYRFARENDADFIATGHYAQQVEGNLLRGIDPAKDQSYFLWALPKNVLPHVLFPLGAMEKSQVRTLALQFDLPVADKRDSQGICFLGPVSIADFLKHELPIASGPAKNEAGGVVGMHEGALVYTLGERVSLIGTEPGPWYVIDKNLHRNELTVAHEPHAAGKSKPTLTLREVSWFAEPIGVLHAQYRYHGEIVSGNLSGNTFTFDAPPKEPVASGQSLVLYKHAVVIGGGIIE